MPLRRSRGASRYPSGPGHHSSRPCGFPLCALAHRPCETLVQAAHCPPRVIRVPLSQGPRSVLAYRAKATWPSPSIKKDPTTLLGFSPFAALFRSDRGWRLLPSQPTCRFTATLILELVLGSLEGRRRNMTLRTQRAGHHVLTGVRLLGLPAGPAVLRGRLRRFALLLPWASPLSGLRALSSNAAIRVPCPALAHLPPPDDSHPRAIRSGAWAAFRGCHPPVSVLGGRFLPHRLPFSVFKRQVPGGS